MEESRNFIQQIIDEDIANGKHGGKVITRFPPEPNGYLHIGHAKSICLNFGIAEEFNGITNLRFDDTNPTTEDTEYVESIKKDIQWLGFDWEDRLYFASDYFNDLYQYAIELIKKGLAYVDDSTSEEMAEQKGDVNIPGKNSPYRDRSVEENLRLFEGMKTGVYDEGSKVLRAKIDMTSPNMNMRDPVMYRIKKTAHHRTGNDWNIYPMYDFAHCMSDAREGITHSLCTLEFENHRPLYDWFIEQLGVFPSRQIEFARLNVDYMITSKRKLLRLVEEGIVSGWDDPRMPTISGMRRRGFTPASIREFAKKVGVAKRDNAIDISLLEFCLRADLNAIATRVMAVMDPLKVVITNYPEGEEEWLPADNNPEDENAGSRLVPFGREIFIERDDFMIDPPKKYFRMAKGRHTRLKNAYILHCDDYILDESGEVKELHCTYVPESKSGSDTSGIKAKGTLHWVSALHAQKVEVRSYDRLFMDPVPDGHGDRDFLEFVNPDSLSIVENVLVEPALAKAKLGDYFQFFRKGYFVLDPSSSDDHLIFNRTITLKDSWSKMQKK
ncbi:glutamine--tRNA ligase/YqeY domain fusion protein [Membranihabitans marinus]|uniref:glutamine--tRNA ligase/YqeY domain fusion protein n=1 Tax=Membranihabitans marinus TaxID=1227546 RepID=UPI001F021C51|nr:glutamine--tRNA ligase/YqeY domain fusion protein [Membranihabitans marinus]